MNILIGIILLFVGFVMGAARERQLFQEEWYKSKQDLEDLKQIYLQKLEEIKKK